MSHALRQLSHNTQLAVLRLVMRLLPGPRPPLLFSGPGSALQMCDTLAELGTQRLLVVTDAVLMRLGVVDPLLEALRSRGVHCTVYDGVEPDPTHAQVEAGIALALREGSEAVLAVGGGSPIDAAKLIAACVTNGVPPSALVGNFKVKRDPLPIYAIPTTAGTGAEVTVAAVLTDTAAKTKAAVVDGKLVPRMAALDGSLMLGLPRHVTAASGMDALTHAVESYVSQFADAVTMPQSVTAVKLVFRHLPRVCADGTDLQSRQSMALAATCAGMAFSRASVGYVHAIAHNLGGLYHTPHGLANAIVLPHILDFYQQAVAPRLAALAVAIGAVPPGASDAEAVTAFIGQVRELSRAIGIPERLDTLREADIPELARRAMAEAQGFYPVPRFMRHAECEGILRKLLP